jgi:hypothetical protein
MTYTPYEMVLEVIPGGLGFEVQLVWMKECGAAISLD